LFDRLPLDTCLADGKVRTRSISSGKDIDRLHCQPQPWPGFSTRRLSQLASISVSIMKSPLLYATKSRAVLELAKLNIKHTRARSALAFTLGVMYLLWHVVGLGRIKTDHTLQISDQYRPTPSCHNLPGADATLIVIWTGSTQLANGQAHLPPSLRCFDHLIFSDFEETYHGEHVFDAFEDVSIDILENNPDFEFHRRLRTGGKASSNPPKLAGSPDKYTSKTSKTPTPSWKLNKWKFLPMANKTLHERPAMKWYVFAEADSPILGSKLQQYLATLDATQPIYAGRPMQIANDPFAHAGSGFVVSQPALRRVVEHYAAHKTEIEALTERHYWASDALLGRTFADSGVPLTHAWPAFQGGSDLGSVEGSRTEVDGAYGETRRLRVWCTTSVSYHQLSAAQVEEMWDCERDWAVRHSPVVVVVNMLGGSECS